MTSKSATATTETLTSSNTITLRGSTEIVTEFFRYSVNNILYQRGIYPPESFKKVSQYGLSMMVTTDAGLNSYMDNIHKQLEVWLMNGSVQKLILVIKGTETGDTLERWVFDCECCQQQQQQDENSTTVASSNTAGAATTTTAAATGKGVLAGKSMKEVTQEIQAIIRQITASVTFLPLLNESCCFDLLVYADKAATVPVNWEDSDPCIIANAELVKFRGFSTKIHKVDLAVSYKVDEDGI